MCLQIIKNPSVFPKAINLTVTLKCNYDCLFCFGKHHSLCSHSLPNDSRMMEIPNILKNAGAEKLTLEGGEPFLYPKLDQLLMNAKNASLTTCVITNCSLISKSNLDKLSPYLDWIGISIDSTFEETEIALGRGNGNHLRKAIQVAGWANDLGIKLKTNTVVTKLNYIEDLKELLRELSPKRAKFFQVLQIENENTDVFSKLKITHNQFKYFIDKHKSLSTRGIKIIPETNDYMTGSYAMILPNGIFFNNYCNRYTYAKHSIFERPALIALSEVGWDYQKFLHRQGLYEWRIKSKTINRRLRNVFKQ